MTNKKIPDGNLITAPQPFSREVLEKVIVDLCLAEKEYTGFISIESGDTQYLLYFFNRRPYAAGKIVADKPCPLSIIELLLELGQLDDGSATISIHATDPVLLKCLLVYLQDKPTVIGPSNLINLRAIMEQIRQEAADALIILDQRQMLNFFFFKGGTRGMSYFSDTEFSKAAGLPVDEQMLAYALQGGGKSVNALIYRTLTTQESTDSITSNHEEMARLLRRRPTRQPSSVATGFPMGGYAEDRVVLSVLDGPQKGQTLSGSIPCVLGRQDADLVVTDPMASKRHAAVQMVNGELMLLDLGSTNGTIVNGRPVRQHAIQAGDIIGIGGTALKVVRITHR